MNNIITMRRLVEIMAQESKIPAEQIDQFLKSFTALITETLAAGQPVSIYGVGEFAVTPDNKILFRPDESLAKEINSPFEIFQPEELADGISAAELVRPLQDQEEPSEAPMPSEPSEISETSETSEHSETPEYSETPESSETSEHSETSEIPAAPSVHSEISEPPAAPSEHSEISETPAAPSECSEISEYSEYSEYSDNSGAFPTFWTIIGLIVGLLIGIGIGFFMHDPIEKMLEPSLDEGQIELIEDQDTEFDLADQDFADITLESDSLAAPAEEVAIDVATAQAPAEAAKPAEEAKPAEAAKPAVEAPAPKANASASSEVKYETVRQGTSLANLAKKHYGERSYWVYIFLENQNVIKNPNRVPQGAKLVIPPLEKYATQATQAERLEAARKKVSEVLRKYPN